MFTVKATYKQETRKINFSDASFFPSYDQLYYQLFRVFPIGSNVILSKLLFSPDSSKPAIRILVAQEVRNAEEYQRATAPLQGRVSSGALLKFSIFDETSPQSTSSSLLLPFHSSSQPFYSPSYKPWSNTSASPSLGAKSDISSWSGSPVPSVIPPPPIIFSTPSVVCGLPLSVPSPVPQHVPAFPVGQFNRQKITRGCFSPDIPSLLPPQPDSGCGAQSQPQLQKANDVSISSPSPSSCCSISVGKQEIQALLTNFKSEFDRIMDNTFGGTAFTFESSANAASSPPNSTMSSIPGAWPEIVPTLPCTSTNEPTHSCVNMWCIQCGNLFGGPWYSCDQCSWHVLCTGCIDGHRADHERTFGEGHTMNRRTCPGCPPEPAVRPMSIPSRTASTPTLANTDREPTPTPAAPAVHRGIICDECGARIVGIRHKCLDCPDFDLCTLCIETGSAERHNPFHEFFEIEKPGRVYVHNVYSGDGERNAGSNPSRSSMNLDSDAARHVPATAPAPTTTRLVGHNATCDLCDSRIRGDRYKCVNCPDFDTCSSCFSITPEQHPQHGFVKIRSNEDIMIRNALASDVRHYASCDGCHKTIYGVRYKCMHPDCPDFDLCGACEAHPIPVHPPTHPMLKMKTSDTVIPTVYRFGQTQIINSEPQEANRDDEKARPLPTPPMLTVVSQPAISQPTVIVHGSPMPEAQPVQEQPHAMETDPPSLASSAAGFTLPPLALDPRTDLFREFWPKVTEELKHLSRGQDHTQATSQERDKNVSVSNASGTLAASAVDPFRDPEPKHIEVESPDLSAQALLSRPISGVYTPEMVQSTTNISLAALLNSYRSPPPHFSCPLAASVSSVGDTPKSETAFSIPSSPALQPAQSERATPRATFVKDTTVPDGQIFPPGAEFVKSWRMLNDGLTDWPESTELHHAAGEKFSLETKKVKIGKVAAGEEVDVWTGELKAPEISGQYRGYWRLSDGEGTYFGHSLWVDITVAEASNQSDSSLASSSVIMMPQAPASALSTVTSDFRRHLLSLTRESSGTVTSKLSMDDTASEGGSVGSSVSLISLPSDDEDEEDWQDSRTHLVPGPLPRDAAEYVVLYDDASSDEE